MFARMTGLPNLPIAVMESTPFVPSGPGPVSQLRLVQEAWGDLIDPRDYLRDEPDYFNQGSVYVPDRIENRANGEDYPIFRTETDLANIRAVGDFFGKRTSGGSGALTTLANYVWSKGFAITAQAAEHIGDVNQNIRRAVQGVINAAMEFNRFTGEFDRELDNRSRRHGETVITLAPTTCGNVRMTHREPSQLTEPYSQLRGLEDWITSQGYADCDAFASSWSFGVHTPKGRHNEPLGYHFVWTPDGNEWDYIEAARVVHVKRNVDACVKRGVSDFYCCAEFLGLSEKLLRNTSVGSSIQAAIAYIKEYADGVTRDQAIKQQTDKAVRTVQSPTLGGTTRTVTQQRYDPGLVLQVSAGQKYTPGPMGSERAPNFINVIQATLRYYGLRWQLSESIVSGDASNANLASSLVAEAPFVKSREADQLVYSNVIRELFWKVLRIAYDAGRFASLGINSFAELQAIIYLKIDPPAVATRDRAKETAADKILVDAGAMAVATMAQRDGLDHQAELDAGAKPAPTQGTLPGLVDGLIPATTSAQQGTQQPGSGPLPTLESLNDELRRICEYP